MPSLPSNFATEVASSSGAFLSNMSGLLYLIIGILIGAVVIEILIGALRHRG